MHAIEHPPMTRRQGQGKVLLLLQLSDQLPTGTVTMAGSQKIPY